MWIILVLVVIAICLVFTRQYEGYTQTIPKVIWTYWDGPNIPTKCIDSWRRYNPDYEIIILDKETTPQEVRDHPLFNEAPQRASDLTRAYVLAKNGGIWADASILATGSFDEFINTGHEFVGYYLDDRTTNKDYPLIENWFFATVPNGEFMTKWKDTFFGITNVDDFLNDMKEQGLEFQRLDSPNYHAMHLCAQHVLQKQGVNRDKMKLLKADDGPFKYLFDNDWNSEKAMKNICNYKSTFHKLRGGERHHLDGVDLNCFQ